MIPVELYVDKKVIIETLERIGIVNKEKKEITPTCYILEYNNKFFISHFKSLLRIQKPSYKSVPYSDIIRRNIILTMLENWGLIEINQTGIYHYDLTNLLFVLPFEQKQEYTINHKINMPKMNRKIISGEISIFQYFYKHKEEEISMVCKKCNSENLTLVKSGPHNKLICTDCLAFQKFLSRKNTEIFLKIKNKNISITANEKLFDRFKILGHKIEDASVIFQNDMELPKNEFNCFKTNMNLMIDELINLRDEIYRL